MRKNVTHFERAAGFKQFVCLNPAFVVLGAISKQCCKFWYIKVHIWKYELLFSQTQPG